MCLIELEKTMITSYELTANEYGCNRRNELSDTRSDEYMDTDFIILQNCEIDVRFIKEEPELKSIFINHGPSGDNSFKNVLDTENSIKFEMFRDVFGNKFDITGLPYGSVKMNRR